MSEKGRPVEYTFRDAQIRSPLLRSLNAIGGGLSRLGLRPSLAPDDIVAAAIKQAGSSDLGSDSYREPLERYLEALERDADLNTFGRIAVRQMLVGSLANRTKEFLTDDCGGRMT